MKWKKRSNFIIVIILSFAYTIVTILNIIGPLHMNQTGAINKLGTLALYSIMYWIISLIITWTIYLRFQEKPEALFFTLIIIGIIFIISGNFLWGWIGS